MEHLIYAVFVALLLILMICMANWGVRRDRKQYKEYLNGRVE